MQNLGKTFILGETEKFSELGGVFCKIPVATSDRILSDWIIKTLDDQVSRVVIEIGDRASDSLKIAYHIRLSVEELRDKALVSIVFISEHPLEVLIETLKEYDSEGYSQILFTEGVHFITADGGEISSDNRLMIEHLGRIAPKDYKTKFLSRISVKPTEKFGRHSLANAWGAYALLKAAGGNLVVEENEFKSSLYFKYRSAQNFDERKFSSKLTPVGMVALSPPRVKNKTKGKAKKILLIDDEASKGWGQALRSIFSMSSSINEFMVINEQVSDYNSLSVESRKIIETIDFDLFLVDLRLNGSSENMDQKPENFSGTKVIKKIKELNPGNQIICFTASSKVWNMKAVLDAGADGYYVKESPEYGFSKDFSRENYKQFQRDVDNCFSRLYLRKVHVEIEKSSNLLNRYSDQDFAKSIISQLNISFDILKLARSKEQFSYAYLMLYLVIEIINSQLVQSEKIERLDGSSNKWPPSKWCIGSNTPLFDWDFDMRSKRFYHNDSQVFSTKPPEWQKICGLYFQLWQKEDDSFVEDIKDLITLRNKFVHNDDKFFKSKIEHRIIYSSEGYLRLFDKVKLLIGFVTNA